MTKGLGAHMKAVAIIEAVLSEVMEERKFQDIQWGQQNHDPFKYLAILGEEVGEANKAAFEASLNDTEKEFKKIMLDEYRAELIQVAAVAVAMVECLDRDEWHNKPKEK